MPSNTYDEKTSHVGFVVDVIAVLRESPRDVRGNGHLAEDLASGTGRIAEAMPHHGSRHRHTGENIYDIYFTNRAQFERAWPAILKVRTPGSSVSLYTIENPPPGIAGSAPVRSRCAAQRTDTSMQVNHNCQPKARFAVLNW